MKTALPDLKKAYALLDEVAVRHTYKHNHELSNALLNYEFDWQLTANINWNRMLVIKEELALRNVTFGEDMLVLTIMKNVEEAATQKWGNAIMTQLQVIKKQFKASTVHDDASRTQILGFLAEADEVRELSDAPNPTAAQKGYAKASKEKKPINCS